MYCSACARELPSFPPVTCPGCGTDHWANAKPCAGALVTVDGRVLLVRRALEPWAGLWDIPGGFCEQTEHPVDAAQREILEETGLSARVVGFIGMWLDGYASSTPQQPDAVTLNIYYHADLAGPNEPRPDPAEVTEVRWFAPEEIPELDQIAFPAQQGPVLELWKQVVAHGWLRSTDLPDRHTTQLG